MAQVAVLQMNMERKVVTSMKANNKLLFPVPANINTFRASLRCKPTFYNKKIENKYLWICELITRDAFSTVINWWVSIECSLCWIALLGFANRWCLLVENFTCAAAATPIAAKRSILAPVKYSLATSPVFMMPIMGSTTTGNNDVTSSGRASVVHSRAIKQILAPHRTICFN